MSPGGSGAPPRRTLALGAAILLAACAALALHAAHYHPFLSDDALISLRYARRLLDGHGLTWTEGRPVEGYSNLLWILCVAALAALGADPIDAARALGMAGAAAALLALLRAFPPRSARDALPAAAGAAALVAAAPIAVWTVGGLEQPLVAACLAWATALALPLVAGRGGDLTRAGAALALALLCLARPDGPLFTAGSLAALGLGAGERRARARSAAWLAALPALAVLGQLAFRLATYGEWLPNPALVKLAPSAHRLGEGLSHVGAGLLALSPFSELALTVACAGAGGFFAPDPARRARLRLLLIQALLWLGYLAAVGGDIFPAYRHFVPFVVLGAFALAEGVAWVLEPRRSARAWRRSALALAVAVAATAWIGLRDHESRRAIAERFEWRGQVVGIALRRAFAAEQPLVAVTAAGAIPYWSELPALDMLGLNDYELARLRPPDFGRGRLAHELGDARAVLAREPDLIVYHVGQIGSDLRVGRELDALPEYREAYAPLTLFGGAAPVEERFVVWARRESPRVGLRREGDSIAIPGHLFAAQGVGMARPDAAGRFAAVVGRGTPGLAERIALPAGRWRLEVDASGPVLARVRSSASGAPLAEGATPLEVEVREPGGLPVDVLLQAPPMSQVRVHGAALTRLRP